MPYPIGLDECLYRSSGEFVRSFSAVDKVYTLPVSYTMPSISQFLKKRYKNNWLI